MVLTPECTGRKCEVPAKCGLAGMCLIKANQAEAPKVPEAEAQKILERQKRRKSEVDEVVWMGGTTWIIKMLDGEEYEFDTTAVLGRVVHESGLPST